MIFFHKKKLVKRLFRKNRNDDMKKSNSYKKNEIEEY